MPRSGKNNERIKQVPRGRKKSAKVEPLRPQAEHPDKLYNDLAKFPSENPYPVLRIHRDGTVLYANKASEPLLKARDSAIGKPAPTQWRRLAEDVLTTGQVAREELKDNGRVFAFRVVPITGSDYVNFYGVDITEQKKTGESLRESENKFKTLADEAFDSIVIHDGQRIIEVNKAFGRLWGYDPKEAAGLKIEKFFAPEGWEDAKKKIQSGYDRPYEADTIRKDGTKFRVEIAGKSIIYKGKPARIATTRDITERKRAEEEFRKSEESYRVTFENTGTATVLIEDDTTISLANTEFERLSGFSKQEIEGKKSWTEFVVKENLAWMLEQHRLRRENRETAMKQYEFRFITKSGDIRDISLLIDVIPGTKRSVASLMDITARKQAECALRTSEERFRSLFEQAADAIVVIDARTGEMAEFNDKAHQMLGYTRTEYAKLILSDIDAIESKEEVAAHIDKIVRQGSDIFETKQRKKDGTPCDVLVSSKLITVAGKPYLQAIWRDITELKKAEGILLEYQKQLKRLAARLTLTEERERRRIAGKIHDEISQTLAIVKIKLDTLQSSSPSEASAAEIAEISSSVEKVIQETRTLTFELSYPILYELGFEAAVAEWLSEQVQKKHGIATEFQDDGQTKPLDDDVRVLLFRNIRELLINIIKHARADKVKVSVAKTDDSIKVTVEDNGVGLNVEEITASRKGSFGLFSIRESIGELGGSFEIESKPGAGCKVTMMAPLKGIRQPKEE
ncbi:MAG: PAS domain S-box protein [Sedimentisphaerales bacterium]